jgi:ATP synthase protein I
MATGVSIESCAPEPRPAPAQPGGPRTVDGSATARRLAFGAALGQAVITLVVALVSLAVGGRNAAASALLGGGISTAGSVVMALIAFRRSNGVNALQMLMGLLVGEAAKIALVIALFVVVLNLMKISPVPLFSAYVATFLVYWVVFASQLGGGANAPSGRESR